MESLLHQSKHLCPFLKKTSPSTLRSLSTATRPSPGGGTMSNLQTIARRCPVMSKALAVQSARMGGNKAFSNTAGLGKAGVTAARVYAGSYGDVKGKMGDGKGKMGEGKAKLHTSGIKGASVDAGVRVGGKAENGMFAFCYLCMRRRHCDGRRHIYISIRWLTHYSLPSGSGPSQVHSFHPRNSHRRTRSYGPYDSQVRLPGLLQCGIRQEAQG